MAKLNKSRNRGNFTIKFTNGSKIKYRTSEAYSNAAEKLAKGRYKDVGAMYEAAKACPTGFEYVEVERKNKELENRFNGIDIED